MSSGIAFFLTVQEALLALGNKTTVINLPQYIEPNTDTTRDSSALESLSTP